MAAKKKRPVRFSRTLGAIDPEELNRLGVSVKACAWDKKYGAVFVATESFDDDWLSKMFQSTDSSVIESPHPVSNVEILAEIDDAEFRENWINDWRALLSKHPGLLVNSTIGASQAAKLLHVSRQYIKKLCKENRLRWKKLPGASSDSPMKVRSAGRDTVLVHIGDVLSLAAKRIKGLMAENDNSAVRLKCDKCDFEVTAGCRCPKCKRGDVDMDKS